MPGDPTEDLDDRLDYFRHVRDQNLDNVLMATDFDDEADFWDAVRDGETVDVELDLADVIVILSELESAAYQPDTAIGHVHTLDLFIQLNEDLGDELEAYIDRRNEEMEELADDRSGPAGMYR